MSEIYGNQINSFSSVVNKFDKTVKSNTGFQKNLINSTNSFYLKMAKKYDEQSKKQNNINKTYFDETLKSFRDIAKSVRSISEDIRSLVNRQTTSNKKIIANLSGDAVFGSSTRARSKQKGFLSTLIRSIQMQRIGVSGVAIAKQTSGPKRFGAIGSFFRAYKAVYNQWELPFQERMLQSLLDMRMAFVDSNKGLRQVWARVLFESPYFRSIMLIVNTFKRLSKFFIIKPLKWLFGERGSTKYVGRLPKSGTAFDRTAITLGLLYTGTMYRLDRLIYSSNESLKQLIILTGEEVSKKDTKYSIFGKYLGGDFIKKIFSKMGQNITGLIPGVSKKRKIKALEIEKTKGLKEWFSVRNLMMEQIDVLKAIYFGITKKKYTAGSYTKGKQNYLLNIQDDLDELKKKKKKIDWKEKIKETKKTLKQDYTNFMGAIKKFKMPYYLKFGVDSYEETRQRMKVKKIKKRKGEDRKLEFKKRKKSGRSTLKVLSDMYILDKRRTEYARQQKLNFSKLNFRAKRGFSKIIWWGLMVLGYVKKIVGGIFSLPLKIVTTLIKYGPRLGVRLLAKRGLSAGKKALPFLLKNSRVLGGVGAAVSMGYDSYQGVKKSKEWYGPKATKTQTVMSGIGGALGGTEGAFTAKGAGYGALKGLALGAAFGGPLGAGIGAIAGGILGFVSGKNISKFLMEFTKPLKLLKKVVNTVLSFPYKAFKWLFVTAYKSYKMLFGLLFTSIKRKINKWKKGLWEKISSPFTAFYNLFIGFVSSIKEKVYGILGQIPVIGKFFKDNKKVKPESKKVSSTIPNIPKMATGGIAKDNMLAYLHKGEEVKPKKYVDNTVKQLKLLNEKLDPKAKPMKSIFSKFLDNWKTGFETIRRDYTEKKVDEKKDKTIYEIIKSLKAVTRTSKPGDEEHLQYAKGGLSGRLSLAEKIAGRLSPAKKTIKAVNSYLVRKNDTIEDIINSTGATWDQLRSWNPDSWGQMPMTHPIYPGHFFFKEGSLLNIYKKKSVSEVKNKIPGVSKSEISKNVVAQKKAESDVTAKTIANQNKNITQEINKQNNKNNAAIVQTMVQNSNKVIKNISSVTQQTTNNQNGNQRPTSPETLVILQANI